MIGRSQVNGVCTTVTKKHKSSNIVVGKDDYPEVLASRLATADASFFAVAYSEDPRICDTSMRGGLSISLVSGTIVPSGNLIYGPHLRHHGVNVVYFGDNFAQMNTCWKDRAGNKHEGQRLLMV